MKKRIKKRLSLLLLALLGFSTACEKLKNEENPYAMYGTLHADFRARGKVTDNEGHPIRGIQVRSEAYEGREILTSEDGSYDISGSMFLKRMRLTFTDIDGPDNGGEFTERAVDVKFTQDDRTGKGDGSWYNGSFAREGIDVTLEEKKQAPPRPARTPAHDESPPR